MYHIDLLLFLEHIDHNLVYQRIKPESRDYCEGQQHTVLEIRSFIFQERLPQKEYNDHTENNQCQNMSYIIRHRYAARQQRIQNHAAQTVQHVLQRIGNAVIQHKLPEADLGTDVDQERREKGSKPEAKGQPANHQRGKCEAAGQISITCQIIRILSELITRAICNDMILGL